VRSLNGARWRTSSYTGSDGGNCVEVATNLRGIVAVRDSKDRGGPVLVFTRSEWRTFLRQVKVKACPESSCSGSWETLGESASGCDVAYQ
jgi:hypothetical protein